MKQKLSLVILVLALCSVELFGQSAGETTFSFLRLPVSARASALGGEAVGLWDNDAGLVLQSPSLITSTMDRQATIAFISYYADINYGSVGLVRDFGKFGTMAFGLSGINYGSFQAADEVGNINGTFRASEYNMVISLARALSPRVQMGASFKPVYSALESYVSYGFAFDMGVTYHSSDSLFSATGMFRNFGTQLKTYAGTYEKLPFVILAGFSLKMKHAPFRIVVTLEQLQNFNLYYNRSSTNEDPFSSDQSSTQSGSSISNFGNEILAHTTTGLEFNPLRGFYFRGGYSFRRRNEIKIVDKPAMVGFSWGFGLKIRRLMFNYARSTYHISGASNILSVSIDIAAKS